MTKDDLIDNRISLDEVANSLIQSNRSEKRSLPLSLMFQQPQKHWALLQQAFDCYHSQALPVVVLNRNAELVYLNPAAAELLQLQRVELIGACWLTQFIPAEQRKSVILLFEQLNLGKIDQAIDYSHEVLTSDSLLVPVSWQNQLFKDEQGEVIGLVSQAVDLYHPI